MKAEKGARCIALPFVHPQRWIGVGGQRQATGALTPGNSLNTHCIGDWVGLRAGLDQR
jgi:hypothetical protein